MRKLDLYCDVDDFWQEYGATWEQQFLELRNVCCADLDHLTRHLVRARERLRHRRPMIIACFLECGYHFSNLPRDQ